MSSGNRAASRNDLSGAAVVRGPMAADHFTQVHNLIIRGHTAIHTKYVGVWAYITSHENGWKLTERHIARDLDVGRDFVRAALRSIENAGCLMRTRVRDTNGTLGESAWFVTDLPIQLQQAGVTDPEVIAGQVTEAYEHWMRQLYTAEADSTEQIPSAEPRSENPPLGSTCDTTDSPDDNTDRSYPSAEPKSGYPTLASPTLDFQTTKKTKEKNTKSEEPTNQPAAAAAPTEPRDQSDGGWLESPKTKKNPSGSPGEQLLAAHGVSERACHKWGPLVDRASERYGRSRVEQQLTRGLAHANNPAGALIKTRLPALAAKLESAAPQVSSVPGPVCGQCDGRDGEEIGTRVVEDADGRLHKCTRCHPHAGAKMAEAA